MTTEAGQESERDGEPGRHRFDDVASLFGGIVPAPGTPVRPMRPFRPIPTALPRADAPAIVPTPGRPDDDEGAESDRPARAEAPLEPAEEIGPPPPVPEPALYARPRPTEMPWPDAFEPRPNYRPRQPRQWSWLLLIPAAVVAASALSFLDPRDLRGWVDANLLHREKVAAVLGPSTGAPAVPPVADEQAESNPYPAIPTSPVPVPPGTEVSPPPPDPSQPAAVPAPPHITIQYLRTAPGAEGEARRLAALLQGVGSSVELRPVTATVRSPTITYYNASDKGAASALALVLNQEASSWAIRLGTAKNPPGTLDVSLP